MRYRPMRALTLTAGATAIVLALPARVAPVLLVLAFPFAVLFVGLLSLRLDLDEEGIWTGVLWLPAHLGIGAPWRDVTWSSTKGVLRCSGRGVGGRSGAIDLRLFGSNWAAGPIGSGIAAWAPSLAAQAGEPPNGPLAAFDLAGTGSLELGAEPKSSLPWNIILVICTVLWVPAVTLALLGLLIGGTVALPVALFAVSAPLVAVAQFARTRTHRN